MPVCLGRLSRSPSPLLRSAAVSAISAPNGTSPIVTTGVVGVEALVGVAEGAGVEVGIAVGVGNAVGSAVGVVVGIAAGIALGVLVGTSVAIGIVVAVAVGMGWTGV